MSNCTSCTEAFIKRTNRKIGVINDLINSLAAGTQAQALPSDTLNEVKKVMARLQDDAQLMQEQIRRVSGDKLA